MKVLFATTHKHLPELHGGMEVNTHELAMQLLKQGFSVGVTCGLAGLGWVGLKARMQIKVFRNACPCDKSMGYQSWRSWDSVSSIEKVWKQFKPDVVVVQGGADFLPLVKACLALGCPVFCYLHTQDRLEMDVEILSNPKLFFIANSIFTKSLHPEKRFCGIVRPLIQPEYYATKSDRTSVVFINPARHKGLDIVLQLARVRRDIPFIFVLNRSNARAELLNLLTKQDINIGVIGPLLDMRYAYSRARIVIAPSQALETWGRIATEAHFSAIPVLASNRGGLPEAVGIGGICLPADAAIEDWLAAISKMWDDSSYYNELSAAARVYSRRSEIRMDDLLRTFILILKLNSR